MGKGKEKNKVDKGDKESVFGNNENLKNNTNKNEEDSTNNNEALNESDIEKINEDDLGDRESLKYLIGI